MSYIRTAIGSYGGGLDPGNPFFTWGKDEQVVIKLIKKETSYV